MKTAAPGIDRGAIREATEALRSLKLAEKQARRMHGRQLTADLPAISI